MKTEIILQEIYFKTKTTFPTFNSEENLLRVLPIFQFVLATSRSHVFAPQFDIEKFLQSSSSSWKVANIAAGEYTTVALRLCAR